MQPIFNPSLQPMYKHLLGNPTIDIDRNIALNMRMFFLQNNEQYKKKTVNQKGHCFIYQCNPMESIYVDEFSYKKYIKLAFINIPFSDNIDIFKFQTQYYNGVPKKNIIVDADDLDKFLIQSITPFTSVFPSLSNSSTPLFGSSLSTSPPSSKKRDSVSSDVQVILKGNEEDAQSIYTEESAMSAASLQKKKKKIKNKEIEEDTARTVTGFVEECVLSSLSSDMLTFNVINLKMVYIIYKAWMSDKSDKESKCVMNEADFNRDFVLAVTNQKDNFPYFNEFKFVNRKDIVSGLHENKFRGVYIMYKGVRYPDMMWKTIDIPNEFTVSVSTVYETRKCKREPEYLLKAKGFT